MKLLKYCFALLAFTFVISSCTKDDLIDTKGEIPTEEVDQENLEANPLVNRSSGDGENGIELDCVTVNYPFDLVDDQGNTYTISEEGDFETVLTDSIIILDFVYPLSITVDGETSAVDSGEQLAEAFASCVPQGGWENGDFPAYLINYDNSCYALDYPVSLVDLDGNTVEVNSDDEFNAAVATELYFFVFPLTLIHEDGTQLVVSDIDGIFDALITCSGFETSDTTGWGWETGFEYIGCYIVEFPLDVVLSDGSVVTANNHMELCDLMITGQLVDYAYPLTLTDEQGNTVIVNSAEELDAALEDCWDGEGEFCNGEGAFALYAGTEGNGNGPCFAISYPVSGTDPAGNPVVVSNNEELEGATFGFILCEIDYPVTLTFADGTTLMVDSDNAIYSVLDDCQ